MTSKLTREQLHERARENVKALKLASRQTAFESAREEILADLQLAELALAAMAGEPVAQDAATAIRACLSEFPESVRDIVEECADIAKNACRAAMLQELKKSAGTEAICRSNENVQAVEVQSLTSINPAPDLVSLQKKAESIIGNYPGIPDGYVMVPMRLTAENGAKGALSGEFSETKFVNCPECFGDDECETCDGSGKIEITVPVTWTTIKAIWVKGVEHFAVTAQEND